MLARILIADDNDVARGRLAELLHTHDSWNVCGEAVNGQQAVSKAAELEPDLIVLDLAMPVMDGLQAAREITRAQPSIPIVLFTVHDLPAVELEAKKVGIRQVVSKSDFAALLSAIEKLLKEEILKKEEPKPSSTKAAAASAGPLATGTPRPPSPHADLPAAADHDPLPKPN